mmetsp:Transcript_57976/g.168160  ORF Transcript_57976/g.168160 Transcript_57976/m.168160 type:complete len:277 (+) Transcript_57976:698-1528(+)
MISLGRQVGRDVLERANRAVQHLVMAVDLRAHDAQLGEPLALGGLHARLQAEALLLQCLDCGPDALEVGGLLFDAGGQRRGPVFGCRHACLQVPALLPQQLGRGPQGLELGALGRGRLRRGGCEALAGFQSGLQAAALLQQLLRARPKALELGALLREPLRQRRRPPGLGLLAREARDELLRLGFQCLDAQDLGVQTLLERVELQAVAALLRQLPSLLHAKGFGASAAAAVAGEAQRPELLEAALRAREPAAELRLDAPRVVRAFVQGLLELSRRR